MTRPSGLHSHLLHQLFLLKVYKIAYMTLVEPHRVKSYYSTYWFIYDTYAYLASKLNLYKPKRKINFYENTGPCTFFL